MKLKLLFAFIISITGIAAQSQLSGKITNAKSLPISGATIYLLNTNQGITADENGQYKFVNLLPGKYELQVSAIGYATLIKNIVVENAASTTINFQLTDDAIQLDAVLVTAQKKEELLQKVPLSITAISAKQVNQYRLWNTKELTAIVPNMYSSNSGDDRNVTSIRGIATTSYDPAVATYIDGVNQFGLDTYIPQLSDIERIEIVRGPQGTLYGRNAMGGVINIITKQPGNTTNGFAEVNIGNYGQQRYSAGIKTPLVKNKLFVGIAAMYNKRNGYYTNTFNNTSFDKQNGLSGNYYLKYIANAKWSFALNVKHQNNNNNGAFPMVNGVQDAFADPFKLSQDATAKMIDNTFNTSLTAAYIGHSFNFTSQTAYQYNHRYYNNPLDGDFSPADAVSVINDFDGEWNRVKVWTQEFKFTSPSTATSLLKWTAGTYLFYQNNPTRQAIYYGDDAALLGAPDVNFTTISSTKAKNYGIAFFGQASYAVTSKLDVIAGLRYDYENKKYNVLGEYQKDPDPAFATTPDTSASKSFSAFSPKLGLAYKATDNTNLFITYSRGYRTGGLTQLSSDPSSQPPLYPYKPEYSNNIEAGIKNSFFDNRLFLNITAFYTRVNDAQVPTLVLPDAITVTRNAGKLESKGLEIEMSAVPAKGLQVDYNIGYTDAVYKKLKLAQYGSAVDLDGKKQIFTPNTTSMLAAQYGFDICKKHTIKFIARGEWIAIGKQYFDLSNTIEQGEYSLFNIRAGLSSKCADIMFWARNLGNKKYIAYAYDFGAIHLGDPRTIGVTLSTRF